MYSKTSQINLTGIDDEKSLHKYLSRTLDFPNYYGANWDAFWDCIVGYAGSQSLPDTLRVNGFEDFQKHMPEAAKQLEECLKECEAKVAGFTVFFA